MCVSVDPFEGFSPSTIFSANISDGERLLAYENGTRPDGSSSRLRQSLDFLSSYQGSRETAREKHSSDNAMILHVPSDRVEILPASYQQLTNLSAKLGSIAVPELSTTYQTGYRGGSFGLQNTFEAVSQGAYDLAVATPDKDSIEQAFKAIVDVNPDFTPPEMSAEMIEFYSNLYPEIGGVSLVLAGFNPSRGMESHPIAVTYSSKNTDYFFPGLEEHSGEVPTVGGRSTRDFRVLASSSARFSQKSGFRFNLETTVGFREKRVDAPNCDYVIPASAIDKAEVEKVLFKNPDIAGLTMYQHSSLSDNDPQRSKWAEQFLPDQEPGRIVYEYEDSGTGYYVHQVKPVTPSLVLR